VRHPSLAAMPLLDVVRLIRSENVGAVTFFHLLRRYGTAAAALEALPELARRGGKRQIKLASKEEAEKEIAGVHAFGAAFIRYGDPDYPELLQELPDAPPLLAVKGNPVLWQHRKSVAFVGSRNATAAGCGFTRKLAKECGEQGFIIVSGLARGIDTAAHQGSLATGTVGVIGGGINNIYPPENRPLYEQIAESGVIISEQPFGQAPHARSFPARNRIIAGMCVGLLVVEASPKSGSLISAHYALEQGREVMAIPGSPLDPRSQGTNGLIKQGATLIESAEDIFRALQSLPQSHRALAETTEAFAFITEEPSPAEWQQSRDRLLSALSPTPVMLDILARETGLPAALLQSLLLELEIAGEVQRSSGGRVSRNYLAA
jgi:DNA processing protein